MFCAQTAETAAVETARAKGVSSADLKKVKTVCLDPDNDILYKVVVGSYQFYVIAGTFDDSC